jgi:3-hydroxyacyl-CoA dehydrogenase
MLERGQLGRKARDLGGFGRVQRSEDGSKRVETFDLVTEAWRDAVEPDIVGVPADLGEVLFADTPHGELAWRIFGGTLRYAAGLVPEIADDIVNVDNAIRWGFNWVHGPFEMLDAIGPQRVIDTIRTEGSKLPAMLQVLHDSGRDTFYGDGTYLGRDGTSHDIVS